MRYFCLASDYDGTLARDGCVPQSTIDALKRVSASGRKLVLATGRTVNSLLEVFPEAKLFDLIVAENGAVLFNPASAEIRLLAGPASPTFISELRRRKIQPLDVGNCIVATLQPNETEVLDVIRDQGLELQVIFNKSAVMILPSGVNKGTGVIIALDELGLSAHNTVGIGDAENDHAFLGVCEFSVAVANALLALKDRADLVTQEPAGNGVEELIERLLLDDLASCSRYLVRHNVLLGTTRQGQNFHISPYDSRVIVAGPSGGGKSTIVNALLERLIGAQYQVCVLDPEGDYDDMDLWVTLGGSDRIPAVSEVLEVLHTGKQSISVNLLGVPLADRPAYFASLLPRLLELRARTGRPHLLAVDEAHHLLPSQMESMSLGAPKDLGSLIMITVHPENLAESIRNDANVVIAIGQDQSKLILRASPIAANELPWLNSRQTDPPLGEMLVWVSGEPEVNQVRLSPSKMELRRHKRKYATGELGEDKSFYFRGPYQKMNIRVQNLTLFTQIAEGIDDETWLYHLRRHDYSTWLRSAVKDNVLADEIAAAEDPIETPTSESRARIIDAIRKQYTAAG